jgi:acylphosphatase
MAEKKAVLFTVEGNVQGVGFRYFVERKAQSLGIHGYVRNMRDGTVEVYAEGDPDTLESLRQHLERGPSFARVENVREDWREVTGKYHSFQVTFDR